MEIIWSKSAFSQLKKLPRAISKRIFNKVDKLKEQPFSLDVKRLIGLPYFRLRIGDYRAIFDIKKDELRIIILKVAHRREIYKR